MENKTETRNQSRDLQGDRQPGILSVQPNQYIHGIFLVDQQRLQISELQFYNVSTLSTFLCWKIWFKTQVSACSSSPSEAMLWIKEVEMVDSVDDLKSSHSIQEFFHFPNFEMLDARIASALNKIVQNSYIKKKVSLEEQKAQKEDRFRRGRQIAYMIYDLPGYWRLWYRSWLRWSICNYSSEWWCWGIQIRDGTKFYYRWTRSQPMMSWKVCKNTWVWSTQNRIGIVWSWNSSKDIETRLSEIENDGEDMHRPDTQTTKLWRQKWVD